MIYQARRGPRALRFAYPNDFRHRACEASAFIEAVPHVHPTHGIRMSTAAPHADRAAPGALAVAFALASVYILWGSTYLAIRFALVSYPPFLLGAGR